MDYLPPGYIQRIGDERFPRFVIRDGLGQYWAASKPLERQAVPMPSLFYRELDAIDGTQPLLPRR